ncbi:predicted protein [Pyrenophora tritici-repentis Pt-1C-BFP]|uniref:Uncharacterized protein n=1 Tax=Pyrenophora tritici-repentis (strain Pt-1C-BFP) TaxID=426418 RepID=B2WK17_PYRTR|nr:uncharacterized protein PTRG_10206 [Pyrenophora tritici-repentis Pt-1C-BFP]EDU43257.1 predicted protein [Pyrenophora tritici-repentis Pt-1C-BFP]
MADAPQVAYNHSDLQVDQSDEQPTLAYSYNSSKGLLLQSSNMGKAMELCYGI